MSDVPSYGIKIRYKTPGHNKISWGGMRVNVSEDAVHDGGVGRHDARDGGGDAGGDGGVDDGGAGRQGVPAIEWDEVEDDQSEDRVGHSFLADEHNGWAAEARDFVMRRVFLQRTGQGGSGRCWGCG